MIFNTIVKYPIWMILVFPVCINLLANTFITEQSSYAIGGLLVMIISMIFLFKFASMNLQERKKIYQVWDAAFLWGTIYHFLDAFLLKFDITFINSFQLSIVQDLVMILVYTLMSFLSIYVSYCIKENSDNLIKNK